MANKTLTVAGVSAIKAPKSGRLEKYDPALPGFGVRVTAAGAKSFIFVYSRKGDHKRRRYTIGSVDAISLADARAEAVTLKDRVKTGGDPAAEKSAADAQVQADAADKSGTFRAICVTYF